MLSLQVVPEDKKDKEWCQENVLRLLRLLSVSSGVHAKDQLCYKLYYGNQKESDYQYLTGAGEYRMPARIRFMPIVRPYFDLLMSTQESRPLEPKVYAVDVGSLDEKAEAAAKMMTSQIVQGIDEAQQRLDLMQMQMQSRRQMLQQATQQGQADPQIQIQIQAASLELDAIQRSIERGNAMLDGRMEEAERQSMLSAQTQKEVMAQHGLQYLMQKYKWKDIFDDGFRDLMLVDNEIYCIDDVHDGHDPSFRKVSPLMFSYLSSQDANWIDEAPGVVETRWMTPSQVLDTYGHEMSAEDRDKITGRLGPNYSLNYGISAYNFAFNELPSGSTDDCGPDSDTYSGSSFFAADLIEVNVCEWQSAREVLIKEEDGTFEVVTDAQGGDRVPGTRYHRRYINEWWGGVRIGGDIYVSMRKLPFQFRDVERIGKAYGRYVGFAYNGSDRRPYSRMWATKDIQILYNLVYYQMELLIALGNFRGIVVDKSQKPKDMKMEDWLYQAKNGMLFIDPTQPTITGRPSNYNQWSTYDLSFAQGIQQCQLILTSLEGLAGRVIGIPPQRLGQVTQYDQATTHKSAIIQSNMTTETLFYKHSKVCGRVLDRMLYTLPYAWKNGKRGAYVNGRQGQVAFKISAEQFDGAKFEVFYDRFDSDGQRMDQALQAISATFQQGGMGVSQLIASFRMRNLDELEQSVDHYEKMAMKRSQEQQQGIAQSEQEKARVEADIQATLKKQVSGGEELKAQIEEMRTQMEMQLGQAEMQKDVQVAQMNNETKLRIAQENSAIELGYMQEMGRKTDIESRLKQLELMLGKSGGMQLSSPRPKNNPRDVKK